MVIFGFQLISKLSTRLYIGEIPYRELQKIKSPWSTICRSWVISRGRVVTPRDLWKVAYISTIALLPHCLYVLCSSSHPTDDRVKIYLIALTSSLRIKIKIQISSWDNLHFDYQDEINQNSVWFWGWFTLRNCKNRTLALITGYLLASNRTHFSVMRLTGPASNPDTDKTCDKTTQKEL